MWYEQITQASIDEAVAAIETAAGEHQFGVLAVHDLKQKMNAKGVEFPNECRVIEVCNPAQAARVLGANLSISNALPCRISVFERDGQTVLSTLLPTVMLEMFGQEDMAIVAAEVEETIKAIMDSAARSR